jgi:Tfp pilus assembly protein PilV
MKPEHSPLTKKELSVIKRKRGFSLVEAMLAIALFSMFATAFTTTILYGEETTALSGERMRAAMLAEEGAEAVRNIRDQNFTNLADGTYGLSTAGPQWELSGTEDVTEGFTRRITISDIDTNRKNILSTVSWNQNAGREGTVSLAMEITNWRAVLTPGIGITVRKVVVNHGGAKTSADFAPYMVGSTSVSLGAANIFDAGGYIISEATDPNYNQTFSGDCAPSGIISVTLEEAKDPQYRKVCTIINEEKLSYITLNKVVVNHGGTKTAEDFAPYNVGTTALTPGVQTAVNSGTYTVAETPDPNYTRTFSGDCDASGAITLIPGYNKICTITNEERLTYVTVNKTVINHGGTKTAANFAPYKVDAATVTLGAATATGSGTHIISETTDPNYTQTFGGDCDASGAITLAAGDNKTCTITNEEKLTHVTVNKIVINHGGAKTAANFAPYKVGTTTVTPGTQTLINHGTYAVTETADPNYTQTFSGDCDASGSITLAPGDDKVCTITNEEKLTYVTVNKTVINHGGAKTAANFAPYKVGAATVTLGAQTLINQGTYTVSETTDPNYTQTFGGDCNASGSITLAPGDNKVCTITNEEKPAHITVNKVVTNHGGTKTVANFAPYKVGTTTVTSGVSTVINSGTYTVSETADPNYIQTFSGACNASGSITLAPGDNKTCTITNEEKVARLTVNKTVINHGAAKVPADFAPYTLGETTLTLGVPTIVNTGTQTVLEAGDAGYTQTFSGDCNAAGTITLAPGDNKVCNITNEEKLSYITINKTVVNHGGSKNPADFAPYKVGSTTMTLGVQTLMTVGTYTVSENNNPDYYAETFSGDCNSFGSITLSSGDHKVCNIKNEEVIPSNGVLIYGDGTTTPKYRDFNGATNTFSAEKPTFTATVGPTWLIRTAPNQHYALAGYYDSSSTLHVMCFNGTTWTNEFNAESGGIGNRHRFDIAFESTSGDAMVIYSKGNYAPDKLGYRTKSGATACGAANWSGETIFTPLRTTNDIMYVKLAPDRRPGSDIIAATWVDTGDDISAAIWNGTAWVNEPDDLTDVNVERISASHDIEDMDLDYESLSGDLMLVWGNGTGAAGTNGVRYRTCTGGIAMCTWGPVTTPPSFADHATSLDISANPDTDEIVFASISHDTSDLQMGYWDGSAWSDTPDADITTNTPYQASKLIAVGWVISDNVSRSVIVYSDSGSPNVNWYTGNRGVFTLQPDFVAAPGISSPNGYMDIHMNPVAKNQLMYATSDNAKDIFAKRLIFVAPSSFTWSNSDGAAIETNLPQIISSPFSFAFWRI